MRFCHILHTNSIVHLLRTSRDDFRPPPILEMKWIIYLLYFYVQFRRVFAKFAVLLTNIWQTNIDVTVTAKCSREGCFAPPPPFLHQEVIDAI